MPNLAGKVAIVTGSTKGIGLAVAERMVGQGAAVVVSSRTAADVEAVAARLGERAVGIACDVADPAACQRLVDETVERLGRLDVLVNNAGYGSAPNERLLSEDGLEFRFQVNHLSHFMLTRMWLPLLRRGAPSRIVNVSSGAQTPIDFDDVMLERGFDGGRAYAQSKLAQILFTVDLAEELEGTGVIVNALHPATYMDTRMVARAGVRPRATVDEGADAVMQLITGDVGSGGYFNGLRPARANAQAYDSEARNRLRVLSEELTGVR